MYGRPQEIFGSFKAQERGEQNLRIVMCSLMVDKSLYLLILLTLLP